MIELIGILAAHAVPAERTAEAVHCGALAAAVRDVEHRSALCGRAGHHAAVVGWCRIADFLPARAGTPVTDDLLARIARDTRRHLARLAQVAGSIEIVVEVEGPAPGRSEAAVGGASYLRAAAHHRAGIEAGLAAAKCQVEACAAAFGAQLALGPTVPGARGREMSLLVRRTAAPRLAAELERALATLPAGFARRISGPWPPYSFASSGDVT
jgi:hypothetical protein